MLFTIEFISAVSGESLPRAQSREGIGSRSDNAASNRSGVASGFHKKGSRSGIDQGRLPAEVLDRQDIEASDLEAAKRRARVLFRTIDLRHEPEAFRILNDNGTEVFHWNLGNDGTAEAAIGSTRPT